MGLTPQGATHGSRTAGKLFASRWNREHWSLAGLCLIISFAVATTFFGLMHRTSAKSVTLVDEGQMSVVLTRADEVGELLAEQAIELGPHDRLSLPLEADVEHGSLIRIERAKAMTVQVDGRTERLYTTADTVGEALADAGIAVAADDRVTPSPDAAVTDGLTVKVVRVRKEIVETQHPIAFEVIRKKDATLPQGKEKVVQTGKEGVLVKRTERIYENGELVAERVLSREVRKPSVDQIVAVGTKKPEVTAASYAAAGEARTIQLAGQTIKVRQILKNVTLTAYSAGPASTGKSPGEPGYGVTASGTKVKEGRTIAVDPDVIPLGWWVYIEGFGFRRAEDTGSAVKGKKIDIYYDSEKTASKFGTKRGYTVYVIGPVKPVSD